MNYDYDISYGLLIYRFIINRWFIDLWLVAYDLAFGLLFRLEFEYAGLNVGKNKFGLNFFIWNMQALTAKINQK